jgi:hypothetical protein
MYVRDGFLLFDLPVESQVIWELARCCKNATTQIQFIVVIFGWTQFGIQVRMATYFPIRMVNGTATQNTVSHSRLGLMTIVNSTRKLNLFSLHEKQALIRTRNISS